jgi:hypothetical protein
MKEYFILLKTFDSPIGEQGEFLGRKNRRKSAPFSNLRELFESYSKSSLMVGWKSAKQAQPYFGLAKLRFPEARLIVLDVFSSSTTIEVI